MAIMLAGCIKRLTQAIDQSRTVMMDATDLCKLAVDEVKLQAVCHKLGKTCSEVEAARGHAYTASQSQRSWEDMCKGACGMAAVTRLLKEHTGFVSAVSASMLVSVGLFKLLSSAKDAPCKDKINYNQFYHVSVFSIALDIHNVIGLATQVWQVGWPQIDYASSQAFAAALNNSVSWLLPFVRGRSLLWRDYQFQHGPATTHESLLLALQPSLYLIYCLKPLVGDNLLGAVSRLPQGFLSHLCCLVCEGVQYGNYFWDSTGLDITSPNTFVQSLFGLTIAIANGVQATAGFKISQQTKSQACMVLLKPAIIEVARLAIVACSRATRDPQNKIQAQRISTALRCSKNILIQMLPEAMSELLKLMPAYSPEGPTTGQSVLCGSSSSSSGSAGSSGSQGSSSGVDVVSALFQNQDPLQILLTDDMSLITALHFLALPWTPGFLECIAVMYVAISNLNGSGQAVTIAVKQACLQKLLHFIVKHTCSWMQLQHKERRGQRPKLLSPLHYVCMAKLQDLTSTTIESISKATLAATVSDGSVASIVLGKLQTWSKMPGSVASLEALLRFKQGSSDIDANIQVIQSFADVLSTSSVPACGQSVLLLSACTSLAVTLGKLSAALPSRYAFTNSLATSCDRDGRLSADAIAELELSLARVASIHNLLFSARVLLTDCSLSTSIDASGGSTSKPSSSMPHRARSNIQDHISESAVRAFQGRVQLKIAITATLLHLAAWRRSVADVAGLRSQFEDVLNAQEDELDNFLRQLVMPSAVGGKWGGRFTFKAEVWICVLQGYALDTLHGRTAPGCCNAFCTNLTGASEASLPTKLCSGCKRVRYCSVQCQKAGWTQGLHSVMCACMCDKSGHVWLHSDPGNVSVLEKVMQIVTGYPS